jgi:predicted nucleotidyltransferase
MAFDGHAATHGWLIVEKPKEKVEKREPLEVGLMLHTQEVTGSSRVAPPIPKTCCRRCENGKYMTINELGNDKRDAILAIAARHGVQRVRVFGSFARGDAGEHSDVDFLIEAGPRTPPWFPGGLLVDLEEELGRRVDIAEESTLDPIIRDRVLREAIPL